LRRLAPASQESEFNRQIAKTLRVGGVDFVAVPGPDGLVLPERAGDWKTALDQVKLLIGAHMPVVLAVVAHQRCAGHPVSDEAHVGDVAKTADALKKETGSPVPSPRWRRNTNPTSDGASRS